MGTTPVLMTSKDLIKVARVAGGELMPLMKNLGIKPYCTTSFPSGRNYHKWTAEAFTQSRTGAKEKDKTYDKPEAPVVEPVAPPPVLMHQNFLTPIEDINKVLENQDKEDSIKQVLQYLKAIDGKLQQLVDVWKK